MTALGYSAVEYTRQFRWQGEEADSPRVKALQRAWDQYTLVANLLDNVCEPLAGASACIWCSAAIALERSTYARIADATDWKWQYVAARCPECGWWALRYEEAPGLEDIDSYFNYAYGILREFDPFALDAPMSAAREFLARHPKHLARFDPYRFEDLMLACLRDAHPDAEIVKLGGRRDGGIDLKLALTDTGPVLIQLKLRTRDFTSPEGVDVVRSLHGVMLREQIFRGMIISTAPRFTADAHKEAQAVERHLEGYSMDLLPLADVIDLLQLKREPPTLLPWSDFGMSLDREAPGWPSPLLWIHREAVIDGNVEPFELDLPDVDDSERSDSEYAVGDVVKCPDGFRGVVATVDLEAETLTIEGWHERFSFDEVEPA
jgi:hypothetical protein